jgi:uncharacterized membrane protein
MIDRAVEAPPPREAGTLGVNGEGNVNHYNTGMTALRYAYVIALVVWLGGMITIAGVVAPATFTALERVEPDVGRTRAATVVGEVLRRFHVVSYVAAAMLLATLIGMKVVGPRPIGYSRRLLIVCTMLAATVVSGVIVDPAIARRRDALGVPIASLAPSDPRRADFARLHAMSTTLLGIGVVGGLILCYWETRE